MSDKTPNLSLPYIQPDQAQKHITVNESLRQLDALVHLAVESRTLTEPPANPREGSRYIVAASPQSSWNGFAGNIAAFQDGGWIFYPPQTGWSAWVISESRRVNYTGASWEEDSSSSPGAAGETLSLAIANGAGTKMRIVTGIVDCSGSYTDADLIPANCVVFAVTGRVREVITGTTRWRLGAGSSTNRYGSGLGVQVNSYALGLTGQPQAYYGSPSPIRLTAEGGRFTGGKVEIAVHIMEFVTPSAS